MSKRHSTRGKPQSKPAKPYPEFPLFPHATGRWCKKIRQRLAYFGPWDDRDAALKKYLEQKDALHAGLTPDADTSKELTVYLLSGRFLTLKKARLETGKLGQRMYGDYGTVCKLLIKAMGRNRLVRDLRPDDFATLRNKLAKKWGPVRLGNVIQRVRSVFKFGYEAGLIDRPQRFGPGFARPSKRTLRLERAKKGPRMFEAAELRRILEAAGLPMKAMLLLGNNAGSATTIARRCRQVL